VTVLKRWEAFRLSRRLEHPNIFCLTANLLGYGPSLNVWWWGPILGTEVRVDLHPRYLSVQLYKLEVDIQWI